LTNDIASDVAAGRLSAEPFGWQAVATSERSLQLCAQLYNEKKYPAQIGDIGREKSRNKKKIRIGYLSGEFREQATAHLLVGVLENHDSTQFEIYAFDNGWDDRSEVRRRIVGSVHDVVDISQLDDSKATAAICEKQIDILINLNGYFGEHRLQVFARRPAPVQVNYLGFPGTLGAHYIDYIIADRHVIPEGHEGFYTEKVVHLPNCYQANDGSKKIGSQLFNRQKCGLPESGFVFCCFNNNYKILPQMFDCWMRLLFKVEGSVLWLLEDSETAASNLKKEAAARGLNPERLIFAPRIPLQEHLSRHRLADLFLDTLPYNAHTTASDALWTGLPLLTQIGDTFPGRVAASLLNAVGLPDLVTATQHEYEGLAIELAANPEKLATIKNRLSQNRLTEPLFNTRLFTRHIERAYEAMYERLQAGLPPENISVPY
jgi:predicted O-linked N-acetylglucosamine transferase (SPINDLY family)